MAALSDAADGNPKETNKGTLFYPKKIPSEVHGMLTTTTTLGQASFFAWWRSANQSNDFWVETDREMIRVYVIPRRDPFNPSQRRTTNLALKEALLSRISGMCISEVVLVLGEGVHTKVHAGHTPEKSFPEGSAFQRLKPQPTLAPLSIHQMPASPLSSVWKMNKSQLQQELMDKAVPIHASWTVPELRVMLQEKREQIDRKSVV